jgi:hypothetical protein
MNILHVLSQVEVTGAEVYAGIPLHRHKNDSVTQSLSSQTPSIYRSMVYSFRSQSEKDHTFSDFGTLHFLSA